MLTYVSEKTAAKAVVWVVRTCKEPEKLKVFDFQPGTDYTHKADGLEGIHNIYLGSDGMHSSDPDS